MTVGTSDTSGSEHANLEVVRRAGEFMASGFNAPAEGPFADDFVFHYYNSQLPELTGDYQGLEGMAGFFTRLHTESGGTFRVKPVSLAPFGDELVASYATIMLTLAGTDLELDALMVWRVVNGVGLTGCSTSLLHVSVRAGSAPPRASARICAERPPVSDGGTTQRRASGEVHPARIGGILRPQR